MPHKILIFLLFISSYSFAQTVQCKSAVDSNSVEASISIIYNNAVIQKMRSDKTGTFHFSSIESGSFVEITAPNFETRLLPYSSSFPIIIYLQAKNQRIDEMVVTGQMQQTSIGNAVQSVRIISSKKIEQMGAQNLTQLFKNELNIQLSNDQILGTGMSLQGISGENVKILVDGVPIIGRLNGSVDLDQINLNNIERIEIVEGPLSVNYGSDALAGTINIITKTKYKSTIQANAKIFYESNGTYNTQFTTAFQFKKTLIAVDINRNYFDGWRQGESNFHVEKERIADSLRTKTFKPREQYFGGIKINQVLKSWENGQQLMLSVNSRLFQEEILNRGTPSKPYYIKAFDETYKTMRFDNSLALNGRIAKKWNINSTNAYNYFKRQKNTYINDLTTLNSSLTPTSSDQDTSVFDLWMSRSSFIYNHSNNWQLELGYDVNYESSRGKRIENTEKAIGDYAFFATSEFTLWKKLILKPGFRASYNSVYNAPIIPSLFVKYQVTKNNGIRFSYSRGFRAPSLKELYFYFVDINHNIQGNSSLKAETSNNFQLALRTDYEKGKCRLVITNQLFFNDLSNLITLSQLTATEYSYVNLLKSQTYGYTLNSQFTRKQLMVDLGMSIQGRTSQTDANTASQRSILYPEIKVNPSYTFNKINTTLAVFYKYTGHLPNFVTEADGSIRQTKRQAFSMLDITASSKFWKERIAITLGVKNLLNIISINGSTSGGAHSGSSNLVQIGMGRTYFCSLSFTLKSKEHVAK